MATKGADLRKLRKLIRLALECFKYGFGCDGSGERQVGRSDTLRKSQDIRAYAGVLEAEHLTGSAEAGNYLIQDQQDTIAIADFTHAFQVAFRSMKYAPASDRRFKNDGSNCVGAFHADHAFELVRACQRAAR